MYQSFESHLESWVPVHFGLLQLGLKPIWQTILGLHSTVNNVIGQVLNRVRSGLYPLIEADSFVIQVVLMSFFFSIFWDPSKGDWDHIKPSS